MRRDDVETVEAVGFVLRWVLAFAVLSAVIAGVCRAEPPDSIPERPDHEVAQAGAVEQALRGVCEGLPNEDACEDRRREDVAETVADILWTVDHAAPWAEGHERVLMIAWAARESRMRDDPSGSNDDGTSWGMFQVKRRGAHERLHRETYGAPLAPPPSAEIARGDNLRALRYLLWRLRVGVEDKVPAACGPHDRWAQVARAMIRLGRGPTVEAAARICLVGAECPEREAPRCSLDSVPARWARQWHSAAPDAWTLVDSREARR